MDLAVICAECWGMTPESEAELVINTTQQVYADESRLKQLIGNVFRNAIEHGGDTVTITVGELDDGFYIADNGTGIPDDESDEVFEQGYSTSNTGTGLGLAVVTAVVDTHDWSVQITESDEGGARFEITNVEISE